LAKGLGRNSTQVSKMIMIVFAGIAEFERDLIRERSSSGKPH